MNWEDVSKEARETMTDIGEFSPTCHAQNKEVKGYMLGRDGEGGKAYWDSSYLRTMAKHFVEVADWLDTRARNEE